jgi:glycosyltransferase involved in cell wall biosynthesis
MIKKEQCSSVVNGRYATIFDIANCTPSTVHGGLRLKGFLKKTTAIKPLITIVTVVYNGADFLEETINSVVEQKYDNIEYIIVDGGSKDGTLDVIKKYEGFIDYWCSQPDSGIYDAMNKGIELSEGCWINFMNAGDVLYNNKVISDIFPISIKATPDIVFGDVHVRSQEGVSVKNLRAFKFTPFNLLLFGTRVVCHQSMFYCKKSIIKYSLDYSFKSELDQWLKLVRSGKRALKVNLTVASYRLGGLGQKHIERNSEEKDLVLKEHFGRLYVLNNLFPIIRRFSFWLIKK